MARVRPQGVEERPAEVDSLDADWIDPGKRRIERRKGHRQPRSAKPDEHNLGAVAQEREAFGFGIEA